MAPANITVLPVELRLKIYEYVLSSSPIHSFRPQRKIGWNRPHADLSNPALLFEGDCHQALRNLFHQKLTKSDHVLVLTCLLKSVKALIIDHADFAVLQKLCDAARGGSGMSLRTRIFASIVARHLREIDFGDRIDEVVCQPRDLTRLLNGLRGLEKVYLSGRHAARYSGTIQDHAEFALDRARKEIDQQKVRKLTPVDEFRRMHLRSPMTDGSRMMISPAGFSGRMSAGSARSTVSENSWVVVDLSMLMWKHYLYTGPPYKDHWRCEKMKTLLALAEDGEIEVVLTLRHVEFDRELDDWGPGGDVYKAQMSTRDWKMQLVRKASCVEFVIRQRRKYDEVVTQDECGLVRCSHARRGSYICKGCQEKIKLGEHAS